MFNFYPTREFIIANPVKHRRDVLACVSKWRTSNKHHKYNQIKQLLHQLAKIYGIKICVMHNDKARSATCYIKEEAGVQTIATITLNNNSIISALHEFAHARYGRSESIACRWSIWLFKKTFPEAMEKLVWLSLIHI